MSRVTGWIRAAFGLGFFLSTAVAAAEEPIKDHTPSPPATTERHWYGWQTLVTDGAGIAFIAVGDAMYDKRHVAGATLASAGVGSVILGGPIVHAAHGRWGTAALDLGLRLTLPIIGAYAASACNEGGSDSCGAALITGAVVGLAPIWIDAGLLAYEQKPARPLDAVRSIYMRRPPRVLARLGVTEVHPTTMFTKRGLALGMGGTF